jgi:hypothetical protein
VVPRQLLFILIPSSSPMAGTSGPCPSLSISHTQCILAAASHWPGSASHGHQPRSVRSAGVQAINLCARLASRDQHLPATRLASHGRFTCDSGPAPPRRPTPHRIRANALVPGDSSQPSVALLSPPPPASRGQDSRPTMPFLGIVR